MNISILGYIKAIFSNSGESFIPYYYVQNTDTGEVIPIYIADILSNNLQYKEYYKISLGRIRSPYGGAYATAQLIFNGEELPYTDGYYSEVVISTNLKSRDQGVIESFHRADIYGVPAEQMLIYSSSIAKYVAQCYISESNLTFGEVQYNTRNLMYIDSQALSIINYFRNNNDEPYKTYEQYIDSLSTIKDQNIVQQEVKQPQQSEQSVEKVQQQNIQQQSTQQQNIQQQSTQQQNIQQQSTQQQNIQQQSTQQQNIQQQNSSLIPSQSVGELTRSSTETLSNKYSEVVPIPNTELKELTLTEIIHRGFSAGKVNIPNLTIKEVL